MGDSGGTRGPRLPPGRVVILGAGPTGLGAAYRLQQLGVRDFRVLEARSVVGGLARSEVDDAGFVWDVGGHVGFSRFPFYNAVASQALPGGWTHHRRQAWIYQCGRYVPYPYQLNIHRLSRRRAWRAGLAMLWPPHGRAPPTEDFGHWARRRFGRVIADAFLLPYNEKVWGCPAEQLGTQWIADRVAPPRPLTVLYSALAGSGQPAWGANSGFRFPRHGGTGALWRAIAETLPAGSVALDTHAAAIEPESRVVVTPAGRFGFDVLISTVPLTTLVERLTVVPACVRSATQALRHSAVHVVGFGFQGQRPATIDGVSWIYFPETAIPFHRVTVLSNYSPYNVPSLAGAWSLLIETTESPWRPVNAERLSEHALAALKSIGLVPRSLAPISVWQLREEYGYPTPSLDRDRVLGDVLPALEARGIYSRGRFGAWRYEVSNQDHSFMQGVEIVDRLLLGRAETVLGLDTRVMGAPCCGAPR